MEELTMTFDPKNIATKLTELSDNMKLIDGGVPYYYFPALDDTGVVKSAFSTRLGGVSSGVLASMNLGTNRGDDPANVLENFTRMAHALGTEPECMILSHQTHTTNVRVVTKADSSNGILRPNEFTDIDGMITNEKGLMLVTSYADCVPLYFVDPIKKVIGLSHSGWRGTVNQMGLHTVRAMQETYGCESSDIIGAIGPSICQECYEISEDVAVEFLDKFSDLEKEFGNIEKFSSTYKYEEAKIVYHRKDNKEKYQLNLWRANELIMLKAGLKPGNIWCANICTCHHPDVFFSHRASNGERGNVCAFLQLI